MRFTNWNKRPLPLSCYRYFKLLLVWRDSGDLPAKSDGGRAMSARDNLHWYKLKRMWALEILTWRYRRIGEINAAAFGSYEGVEGNKADVTRGWQLRNWCRGPSADFEIPPFFISSVHLFDRCMTLAPKPKNRIHTHLKRRRDEIQIQCSGAADQSMGHSRDAFL